MLATLMLFLSLARSIQPTEPPTQWAFELVIRAAGQEWTMRIPLDEYLSCEEMRDVWLTDGPRDTEEFESETDCVQIERDGARHHP